MSCRSQFIILGILCIAFAVLERGWFFLLAWLGVNFIIFGIAHGLRAHGLFGKRPDGTLPLWRRLLFLPLLLYTNAVWHLLRLLSREPKQNAVTTALVVGRRLLPAELDGEFANIVDLTAEFSEPSGIRRLPSYFSFPVLDASAPLPAALREAVSRLKPGRTIVHCAQGHGRTGLFALALLLSSGTAHSVEEGLQLLSAPGRKFGDVSHFGKRGI